MSSEFLWSNWLIKCGCEHDHSDLNPKERHGKQRAAPSLRLGGTVWLRAASGGLGPRYRTDLSCSDLTTGNSLWRHQRDEERCRFELCRQSTLIFHCFLPDNRYRHRGMNVKKTEFLHTLFGWNSRREHKGPFRGRGSSSGYNTLPKCPCMKVNITIK